MTKHTKVLLLLILVSVGYIQSYAQGTGVALDAGYKYNKRSQFYLGGSLATSVGRPYNSMGDPTLLFGIGGGASIGSFNGQTKMIPTGHLSVATGGVMLIEGKLAASKYFINPSIGSNAINFLKIDVGYSFPFKNINGIEMKGITVGVTLSLGNRGYYVDLSN